MPVYEYTALDKSGKSQKGIINADSPLAAREKLRGSEIFPVEVKSGASGRLRSLHMLLESYPNCPQGYALSSAPYSRPPEQQLTFLPLYYAYSTGMPGA